MVIYIFILLSYRFLLKIETDMFTYTEYKNS